MRYSPEKIDEIRAATDIVDLIGSYVRLKKRGKNFVGLCPFHTEKTPSFNVSPERQMFHCFGCGVGGNVFTFLMELEKVSFPEAVRTLGERAGIPLPQPSGADAGKASETEEYYEACSMAGRFYYQCLTETVEGKLALEYFHHRGFSDETIRKFGLGYAPHSWDALIRHAASKNVPLSVLAKAGLLRQREDSPAEGGREGYYDYFRGRAMFPIFTTTGRVVGFGARKLREDDPLGKYINSPETPIFNKSRILYGLYHAKEAIREKDCAVLVEGYADLISVFQAGIRNVVASSGTALTTEQVQLVGRYTKNIIIVYDADSAGSKAALRGVDVILENNLDVKVAQLPQGDDPDSFVRKHGGKAFEQLTAEAVSFVDFIARAYERMGKFTTPEGQAEAIRAIVQTVAKMQDELKRHFYIKQIAEQYKLYESVLYRELEKYLPRSRASAPSARTIPVLEPSPGQPILPTRDDLPAAERDLLHAMLEGRADVLTLVFQNIVPEDFMNEKARQLGLMLRETWNTEGAIDSARLVNELEDESLRRLVAKLLFTRYELSKRWKESGVEVARADPLEVARDAIVALRKRSLSKRIEENQRQIQEAGERGEDITQFLAQRQRLLEEMKSLSAGMMQAQ